MYRRSIVRTRIVLFAASLVALPINSSGAGEVILHDNTGADLYLLTGAETESGVDAPTDSFWSELQHDAGNMLQANNVIGFSVNAHAGGAPGGHRVADDFVVPSGKIWLLDRIYTWAYKPGADINVNPFDEVRLQIWKGEPGAFGSYIIFGDLVTNRLSQSDGLPIYRIANTVVPAPGVAPTATRQLWSNEVSVLTEETPLQLLAGHYWVEWQNSTIDNTPSLVPPLTVSGARGLPGSNARHFVNGWTDLVDGGTPVAAADVPQDLPFRIIGDLGNNCNIPLKHCPEDVDGAGDLPDNEINVLDLLTVIAGWGEDGNAAGERPLGDVAGGSENGDCKVDVLDLLAVISAWGSCPPPFGACCLSNGDCLAYQTADDCKGKNGTYAGDFSDCGTFECPTTPP